MIQRRPTNVVGAFCILLSCDNSSEALVKHMSRVWLTIVARMVDNCRAYGWQLSRVWLTIVARMVDNCRAYGWHMFHHTFKRTLNLSKGEWKMHYGIVCKKQQSVVGPPAVIPLNCPNWRLGVSYTENRKKIKDL